jgi:hypothetical protein
VADSIIVIPERQRENPSSASSSQQHDSSGHPATAVRISRAVMAILILCYALQVFSPIRLNPDAITLLSMAKSAAAGHGFLENGRPTVFPPGYPALLAILLRTGLGHSWAIIGLNGIMMAAGMFAAYQAFVEDLFDDKVLALNLCSLSMLSFVVIKHFTIAITDIAFLFVAMCAVAAMSHAALVTWGRRFALTVAASWILVIAAIAVRRIGVALIPPFVLMVISRPETKRLIRDQSTLRKALAAAFVGAGLIGIIWAIARTSTLSDLTTPIANLPFLHTLLKILYFRLTELGGLMINVPISHLPTIVHGLVPVVGLALLLLTLGGVASVVSRRKKIGPAELYLVSYLVVLFAWPYNDARFWIPVVPLLAAYSAAALGRAIKFRPARLAIAGYISIFVILGIASIAYSTRITFAGSKFPDLYSNGLRPTYCEAFKLCSNSYNKSEVDPEALDLIQIYR